VRLGWSSVRTAETETERERERRRTTTCEYFLSGILLVREAYYVAEMRTKLNPVNYLRNNTQNFSCEISGSHRLAINTYCLC